MTHHRRSPCQREYPQTQIHVPPSQWISGKTRPERAHHHSPCNCTVKKRKCLSIGAGFAKEGSIMTAHGFDGGGEVAGDRGKREG